MEGEEAFGIAGRIAVITGGNRNIGRSIACLFLVSNLANYTTAQEFFVSGGAFPLVRMPGEEYSAEEF
ncbi:MAG: hypothetical protein A3F74_25715 [Betaproteobacteria bacterium RIFCSPLOWO2_12_FULL_62_58]|nr:MAG: hypothetical protein A3F74_25715 [Betaproteobacteria bacterium RIFCSPLOWO2_12_FULL_62_58]